MSEEKALYDVVGAFQSIEEDLIKSMQRTMKKHIGDEHQEGINWSQWQAEMLNGLAQFKEENADKLKGYYSTINDDIDAAIRQAYATGESETEAEILKAIKNGYKAEKVGAGTAAMQGAFFAVNSRKLNSLIKSTQDDFKKAEHSILRRTEDIYRQTIFKTQMHYNTGAKSLWQAVDMAAKDFLSAGINSIEYKNGARVNIASYAEMALRTANKRANLAGCGDKRTEYGLYEVIVSRHNAACPKCIPYQGKVYIDDIYQNPPEEVLRKSKHPRLSKAVSGGMFHPNCKNGVGTYYEGITDIPKPPTKKDVEEMNRVYNLTQRQRECERNIRKYSRLSLGSQDVANASKYSAMADKWKDEYNRLIRENKDVLRKEPERLKLFGVGATPKTPKIEHSESFNSAVESLKNNGVEYKKVEKLKETLTDKQIIEKLSGGDMTQGSCSSLAFAYIANRVGLDVTDYRGGKSREFFSYNANIEKVMGLKGVKGRIELVKKEARDTAKILNNLPKDKEYYLAVGRHAAIVRNSSEKGLQYLELQSIAENGWFDMEKSVGDYKRNVADTLNGRFRARKTVDRSFGKVWEKKVHLIEVDSFKDCDEFKEIMGYINTAADNQKKGVAGNVK